MLSFRTDPITEEIYLIIHFGGKYTPWCYLNPVCINVLQMESTSKTSDDQNVNLQNEQIKWVSNLILNAILFQIKFSVLNKVTKMLIFILTAKYVWKAQQF